MGAIKNMAIYGLFLALGSGMTYHSCVDHKYKVVKTACGIYVQDKDSGMMSEVNDKFDVVPSYSMINGTEACRQRDIADRVKSAYREFTR